MNRIKPLVLPSLTAIVIAAQACALSEDAPGSPVADGGPLDAVAALPDGDVSSPNAPDKDASGDAPEPVDAGLGTGDASTLGPVSDTFAGGSLAPFWSVIRPDLLAITPMPASGQLRLSAPAQSLWYNTSTGPLVFQNARGDFSVTARVRVRRATNPSAPPTQRVHLAGLMARAPGGGPESYVFIVVGQDVDDLSVETKTTVGGVSTFAGPSWPTGDAELRICRFGSTFELFKRELAGGPFVSAATYARGDLPADLQVGPFLYADSASPDLAATFDEVTFATVTSAADCAR